MAKKFRVFPVDGYSYETTYNEYIRSRDWWIKATQFKEARGFTCEQCGLGGYDGPPIELHVHHKHYRTLGREKLEDVKVLCEWCHKLEHKGWGRA